MIATGGQPLEVVYPGRLNDSRGGDFRDAVILFGKEIVQGNIEIHSTSSGWQIHGHHRDPQYNQVALHVVWQQDCPGPTLLEDGRSIPTVVLDRDLYAPEGADRVTCRGMSAPGLGAYLEGLGEERLAEKVGRIRSDILELGAEQSLYARLMEALGYTKNQQPFLELARLAPLKKLEAQIKDRFDLCGLESFLFGTAGLLPSQRGLESPGGNYLSELESNWNPHIALRMSCSDWELYKVRPCNYPVRRIAALARLILRYHRPGWLETWRRVMTHAVKGNIRVDLCNLLMVKAEGYWKEHHDFKLSRASGQAWLLGRERAVEIIINVILPFFIAWSECRGDDALITGLKEYFRRHRPCETNSIQRHMINQLKAGKGLVNSALRQQGILHLYKTYCIQGRCIECALYG